jgi:hypothetical protein
MCDIALDEVVHFDEITRHPTTGAATDVDSGTPTFSVFEEATDTPILSAQSMTKRTSLTGNYRGTFTMSTANGFEVGKWYNVITSATVNAIADKTVSMRFRCTSAETTVGNPKVDAATLVWAATTRTLSAGTNIVLAKGTGITGFNDLDAAGIRTALGLASANLDTQLGTLNTNDGTINTNVLAIAARIIALATKTGAVVADGGNSTTVFKTDLSETSNDHWKESFLLITSGTLVGSVRKIDGYNGSTKVVTITPAFPSTPANSVTFAIVNR